MSPNILYTSWISATFLSSVPSVPCVLRSTHLQWFPQWTRRSGPHFTWWQSHQLSGNPRPATFVDCCAIVAAGGRSFTYHLSPSDCSGYQLSTPKWNGSYGSCFLWKRALWVAEFLYNDAIIAGKAMFLPLLWHRAGMWDLLPYSSKNNTYRHSVRSRYTNMTSYWYINFLWTKYIKDRMHKFLCANAGDGVLSVKFRLRLICNFIPRYKVFGENASTICSIK